MSSAVKLKICGVTHADDLDVCRAHRVDAVGLNLWPKSKRALTLDQACPLAQQARSAGLSVIGVFVDPDPESLRAAAQTLDLDAVQLHGDAPPERYAGLALPWIWVIRGTPSLDTLRVPEPAPAWILLDAAVSGFGGQGVTTDWDWARAAVQRLAPRSVPVWLAGGLNPTNAALAIERVRPHGLDVASGAERKGDARRKDTDAIAALASICQNPPAP